MKLTKYAVHLSLYEKYLYTMIIGLFWTLRFVNQWLFAGRGRKSKVQHSFLVRGYSSYFLITVLILDILLTHLLFQITLSIN